jgi:predicted RNA-binding Zn-ribbon protein involved in translation (DUF1610 family)
MERKDVASSRLPTFLLPCPQCGQRMAILAVSPATRDAGGEAHGLEDVTHGCPQCGTTLTRMVRPLSGDAREIAQRF